MVCCFLQIRIPKYFHFEDGVTMQNITRVLVIGCLLALLGQVNIANAETPGERFRKAIEREAEYCATHKIKPTNRRCDITKLQPADPLATEEGRFAHSIKIPNPVPDDSGYKPGMTPQEYFDHLCKTEAGEFIYKTVENVDGLLQMRPRDRVFDSYMEHLYALEDPFGYEDWEAKSPQNTFVRPQRYRYFESPLLPSEPPKVPNAHYKHFYGYDDKDPKTMSEEPVMERKSQYGFTWRGINRSHDRELGIAGGELIILDLRNNEVLAVRRGFIQSGHARNHLTGVWWLSGNVCPKDRERIFSTYEFISRVLLPMNSNNQESNHATK
jgi:hypothetical protein